MKKLIDSNLWIIEDIPVNRQAQIFLTMMAGWMNRKQQRVIEFLMAENKVLKEQFDKTGKKLRLTDAQRYELAKKGKLLARKDLQAYASLVTPRTILDWHRKLVAQKYTANQEVRTERQKQMAEVRKLAIQFAEENADWGYGRIQGALANLGYEVSETTVGNILRKAGILPAPERKSTGNWGRFIRSHLDVTAVADFFTVEVWSLKGLVRYHVLFVMTLGKREVKIAHIGCDPDGQVMEQIARNLTDCDDGFLNGQRFFICDHDSLYTKAFRETLASSGIETIRTRVGCPVQNAYAESFVSTIRRECLDHLILFGEKSLRRAISQYMEHYHHERNHQGIDNLVPFPYTASRAESQGVIRKSERLGGLLKYYHREIEPEERKERELAA